MARARMVLNASAVASAVILTASIAGGVAFASGGPNRMGFNRPGDVLIADQFNNRVIEVNAHHQVAWRFGNGSTVAGPHSVVAPNDAERVGADTLISGAGAPAGAEPGCSSGCPDNRVLLVSPAGSIVWQYGKAGVAGSSWNRLNNPNSAELLANGHILIADESNNRVLKSRSRLGSNIATSRAAVRRPASTNATTIMR